MNGDAPTATTQITDPTVERPPLASRNDFLLLLEQKHRN